MADYTKYPQLPLTYLNDVNNLDIYFLVRIDPKHGICSRLWQGLEMSKESMVTHRPIDLQNSSYKEQQRS